MDFLPIQPTSTNKVDASINLANDGGSKSNSGYINTRGQKNDEEGENKNFDEVSFSKSKQQDEIAEEDMNFIQKVLSFLNKIKNFILKILGIRKVKVPNIYEKST